MTYFETLGVEIGLPLFFENYCKKICLNQPGKFALLLISIGDPNFELFKNLTIV